MYVYIYIHVFHRAGMHVICMYIYIYVFHRAGMHVICMYIYICIHVCIYIHNKVCIHLCMHKYCTQCKLGVHILSILEVARNDLGLVQSHAIPLWAAG